MKGFGEKGMPRVVLANEADLPWLPLKDVPGFGGLDIEGVESKFFGKPGVGPWIYLGRHAPGTVVGRHTHRGDVFHYIIEGEWQLGNRVLGPGAMHYEQQGLFYGPIVAGSEGTVFLAAYDHEPMFIEKGAGDVDDNRDEAGIEV